MSGFPREVLKWLQGLGLSHSLRNIKRDFANGSLVAEICSKYFPQEVQLHSFSNGCNLMVRKENWKQLAKLFRRHDLPILSEDVDHVLHCASDAARDFIINLYCLLETKKSFHLTPTPEPSMPSYAQPTASQLLKADELNRIEDQLKMSAKAEEILSMHTEKQTMKRLQTSPLWTHPLHQHFPLAFRGTRPLEGTEKAFFPNRTRPLEGTEKAFFPNRTRPLEGTEKAFYPNKSRKEK